MSFKDGAYLKIWTLKPGRFADTTDVRVSSSRKKQDNTYETDFSGFCTMYADANKKVGQFKLKEGDTIKVIRCDVTNQYNKEKNTTYTNYRIFDFDMATGGNGGGNSTPKQKSASSNKPDTSEGDNDEFPL